MRSALRPGLPFNYVKRWNARSRLAVAFALAACGYSDEPVDITNGTSQGFLTAVIGSSRFDASLTLKATMVDSTLAVSADDVYHRQITFTVHGIRMGDTGLPRSLDLNPNTV
jgi:hypothetical protein